MLAIVPARGGSKGIPRKNVVPVGGRALISWTICAALRARSIDRVVVSTDDPRIRKAALDCGAEVPFTRPARLSTDSASTMDVLVHALKWLSRHEEYLPEYVMCLQPTSPLRTALDIDRAVEIARARKADSVVSLVAVSQHPEWMNQLEPSGRIRPLKARSGNGGRRQVLAKLFVPNGAIYLARRMVLLTRRTWYVREAFGYVMPQNRSLDIDTPFDLALASQALLDRKRSR